MSEQKSEGFGVLWKIMQPVKRYIYSAMGLAALGIMGIGMFVMSIAMRDSHDAEKI